MQWSIKVHERVYANVVGIRAEGFQASDRLFELRCQHLGLAMIRMCIKFLYGGSIDQYPLLHPFSRGGQ